MTQKPADLGLAITGQLYGDFVTKENHQRTLSQIPALCSDYRMPIKLMRLFWSFALTLFCTLNLAGCQIAGDIFKAGVWVGVILVVAVIAGIIWLVTKRSS